MLEKILHLSSSSYSTHTNYDGTQSLFSLFSNDGTRLWMTLMTTQFCHV